MFFSVLYAYSLSFVCTSISAHSIRHSRHHAISLSRRADLTLDQSSWIWTNDVTVPSVGDSSAPPGTRSFRKTFDTPTGQTATSADILIAVDNGFTLYLNGELLGSPLTNWDKASLYHVTNLNPTSNVFAVNATNFDDSGGTIAAPNPAGLIVSIQMNMASGVVLPLVSDATWLSNLGAPTGFEQVVLSVANSSVWTSAKVIGKYGITPWAETITTLSLVNIALKNTVTTVLTTSLPTTPSTTQSTTQTLPTTTSMGSATTPPVGATSTATVTGAASTNASDSTNASKSVNPALIGGIVGGIGVLILIAILVFVLMRQRRSPDNHPIRIDLTKDSNLDKYADHSGLQSPGFIPPPESLTPYGHAESANGHAASSHGHADSAYGLAASTYGRDDSAYGGMANESSQYSASQLAPTHRASSVASSEESVHRQYYSQPQAQASGSMASPNGLENLGMSGTGVIAVPPRSAKQLEADQHAQRLRVVDWDAAPPYSPSSES